MRRLRRTVRRTKDTRADYGAVAVAQGHQRGTWYWNWYRSQRTSLHVEGQKRGRNRASVLKWTFHNRASKPVRRGSPTLGRFDSCAAPFKNCLHIGTLLSRGPSRSPPVRLVESKTNAAGGRGHPRRQQPNQPDRVATCWQALGGSTATALWLARSTTVRGASSGRVLGDGGSLHHRGEHLRLRDVRGRVGPAAV